MKIKALLVTCAALFLSGCTTVTVVGTMVEAGAKQLVDSPEKEWVLIGENNERSSLPIVLVWSEEPLFNLDDEKIAEASNRVYREYKGGDFPNRYLNVFTVEQLISYKSSSSKENLSQNIEGEGTNSSNRKRIVIRSGQDRIFTTKLSHASFDLQSLMMNKSIMFGSLIVNYDKNTATLIYNEADLADKKVNMNTGEVYYKDKQSVILESKDLLKLNQ